MLGCSLTTHSSHDFVATSAAAGLPMPDRVRRSWRSDVAAPSPNRSSDAARDEDESNRRAVGPAIRPRVPLRSGGASAVVQRVTRERILFSVVARAGPGPSSTGGPQDLRGLSAISAGGCAASRPANGRGSGLWKMRAQRVDTSLAPTSSARRSAQSGVRPGDLRDASDRKYACDQHRCSRTAPHGPIPDSQMGHELAGNEKHPGHTINSIVLARQPIWTVVSRS